MPSPSAQILQALKGKRVALLGATSNVARALIPYIKEAGVAVFKSPRARLPDDIDKLPKPEDVDVIIHLAAVTKPAAANRDPWNALGLNVATVHLLLHRYNRKGCRLVLASTIRSGAPDSTYAWTKSAAEAIAVSAQGPHVVVVRFGNVLETSDVVSALVRGISGRSVPGQRKRVVDFGYVAGTTDYFHPGVTIPHQLACALSLPSGSMVTPVLPEVPIPYLAGMLAAYAAFKMRRPVDHWKPRYEPRPALPPLIPHWWLRATRLRGVRVRVDREWIVIWYLVTDMRRCHVPNRRFEKKVVTKAQRLQKRIEKLQQPRLGSFLHAIDFKRLFREYGYR